MASRRLGRIPESSVNMSLSWGQRPPRGLRTSGRRSEGTCQPWFTSQTAPKCLTHLLTDTPGLRRCRPWTRSWLWALRAFSLLLLPVQQGRVEVPACGLPPVLCASGAIPSRAGASGLASRGTPPLDGRPSIPTCTPWKTDTGIAVGILRSSEETAGIWGLAHHGRWQGTGCVLLNTDTKEACRCRVAASGQGDGKALHLCPSRCQSVLMSVTAVAPCPRVPLPPGRLVGGELEGGRHMHRRRGLSS